ncbi:unnamed protein product [Didymodactylos carnosus]|uniref:Uncharacterized protein n=1 Tax=Didymodactylos carnosus TaxID=1234261 RepID=A0A8S2W0G4_9BILA|nr:unnamed protein product [Didymodactylos carnosus]CAF4409517.1 unnamed protein product [Didymodactylos carnosus]
MHAFGRGRGKITAFKRLNVLFKTSNDQLNPEYGVTSLQGLIDSMKRNALHLNMNFTDLKEQYKIWKELFLNELEDPNTYEIWTTKDQIIKTKFFFTEQQLADNIQDYL